jgi:hypothetical protein
MSKTTAHTQYKLKEGTPVPGVTTVLGILNKPALVKWANNLGLQGIDSTKYRDAAANVGTLSHAMICAHLKGEKADTSEYSQQDISMAETSLIKYWDWEKEHVIEPVLIEEPLVSEEHGFGGTIDSVVTCNGELWLVDYKTGKAIYPEMFIQLAAYSQLLKEHKYDVENTRILRIGRNADEGFEERVARDLTKQWQVFYHLLQVYKLQKEIGR